MEQVVAVSRVAIAVAKSLSFPEVGRYTPIWVVVVRPGIERWMGRTAEEVVGRTVMNGEIEECHRQSVPPHALLSV